MDNKKPASWSMTRPDRRGERGEEGEKKEGS